MPSDDDTWLDHLDYDCIQADLFSLDAEAVAIPVNVTLTLNYTLGRAAGQRGGTALLERLQTLRRGMPGERMALGTATSVDTRDLPHLPDRMIFVAWWNEDTPYDDRHLQKCYTAALREALTQGVRSLVLPSLGGRGGVSPERRARAICTVLKEFDALPRSSSHSLTHLIFADVASGPVQAIQAELDRRLYLP